MAHVKPRACEVRAIYEGHEIAAHTLTHPSLTKLTDDEVSDLDSYDLFRLVGKKRGFLNSGGDINHARTAEMLLEEFRSAKIGKITLEMP